MTPAREPALGRLLWTLLLLCTGLSAPAAAQERFYIDRLQDGIALGDAGSHVEAARMLEIACFGLLDYPERLVECLALLALAEDSAGDTDGSRATAQRLDAVEERFGVYLQSPLDESTRTRFEELVMRLPAGVVVSPALLERIDSRRETQRRNEIAGLAPRQQVDAIRRHLTNQPDDLELLKQLALLELQLERPTEANEAATRALELGGEDDGEAVCLWAAAQSFLPGTCAAVVDQLDPCPLSSSDVLFARQLLECRTQLSQWGEARLFLTRLPLEIRRDRRIAKLERTIERRMRQAEREQPRPAEPAPAGEDSGEEVQATDPAEGSFDDLATPSEPPVQPPDAETEPLPLPAQTSSATADVARSPSVTTPKESPKPPTDTGESPRSSTTLPQGPAATARRLSSEIRAATNTAEIERLAEEAIAAARRRPDVSELQNVAGFANYRAGRWLSAISYFLRGGEPEDDRPDLLFYLAVSYHEAQYHEAAAQTLKRALPNLEQSDYVRRMERLILTPR